MDQAIVTDAQNCGNILAGVGPFAIERGLVKAQPQETVVRIQMVNTGQLTTATVQTPGGSVSYAGEARIDSVPGTAAPDQQSLLQADGFETSAKLSIRLQLLRALGAIADGPAAELADVPEGNNKQLSVEHPSGEFTVVAVCDEGGAVQSAGVLRTARKLADGVVFN